MEPDTADKYRQQAMEIMLSAKKYSEVKNKAPCGASAWKRLNLFHATQQGLQTFLPAVLLFFQMVVLTLQLFALMLGILNFLRQ